MRSYGRRFCKGETVDFRRPDCKAQSITHHFLFVIGLLKFVFHTLAKGISSIHCLDSVSLFVVFGTTGSKNGHFQVGENQVSHLFDR
jgi:hypothetical protein